MSAKSRQKLDVIQPPARYVTAIAVVYDSACCCCNCSQHRTGKIRSEMRYTGKPPGMEMYTGPAFPMDRERGNGPLNSVAIRSRAKNYASIIGVPFIDETEER